MKGKKLLLFLFLFTIIIISAPFSADAMNWNYNRHNNYNSNASYGVYTTNTTTLDETWDYTSNTIYNYNYDTYTNNNYGNGTLSVKNTNLLNGVLLHGYDTQSYQSQLTVYESSIQIYRVYILIPINHTDRDGVLTITSGKESTDNFLELYSKASSSWDSSRIIYQTTNGASISWTQDDLVTLSDVFEMNTTTDQKYLLLYTADNNGWYDYNYRITKISVTYYTCDVKLYQQESSNGREIRWIAIVSNVYNNVYSAELTIRCMTTDVSYFVDKDETRTVTPTKIYTSILNNNGSYYRHDIDGTNYTFDEKEGTYYIIYVLKLSSTNHKEYVGCDVSAHITVNDRESNETSLYRIVWED